MTRAQCPLREIEAEPEAEPGCRDFEPYPPEPTASPMSSMRRDQQKGDAKGHANGPVGFPARVCERVSSAHRSRDTADDKHGATQDARYGESAPRGQRSFADRNWHGGADILSPGRGPSWAPLRTVAVSVLRPDRTPRSRLIRAGPNLGGRPTAGLRCAECGGTIFSSVSSTDSPLRIARPIRAWPWMPMASLLVTCAGLGAIALAGKGLLGLTCFGVAAGIAAGLAISSLRQGDRVARRLALLSLTLAGLSSVGLYMTIGGQ